MPDESNGDVKTDSYLIRRTAIDFSIPLINNIQLAKRVIEALLHKKKEQLLIQSWDEYVKNKNGAIDGI